MEAGSVIGMRLPRLLTGDAAALAEARLMVSEKMEAAAALQWALMTGGLGTSVPGAVGASISHYRKAVGKNRRRLSKPRKQR